MVWQGVLRVGGDDERVSGAMSGSWIDHGPWHPVHGPRTVQLLADAYPDRPAIRAVLQDAGVDPAWMLDSATVGEQWHHLAAGLCVDGGLRRLLDVAGRRDEALRAEFAAMDVEALARPVAEHWLRSVRGTATGTAFLFTGRQPVLDDVARFAGGDGPGLAVLTGMPGAGKSAVLGALVVRGLAPGLLPVDLLDRVPDVGPAAAVHASDASVSAVVGAVATALRVEPGDGDVWWALNEHLARLEHAPVLVVDAVDEAAEDLVPALLDLARQTRLIVGLRSSGGGDPLPGELRAVYPTVIDLDDPAYHAEADVAAYVARRLATDRRPDGYGRVDRWPRRLLVDDVGREVGRAARRNFLIAQFITEELLARDPLLEVPPGWSAALHWPSRVEGWMRRDLRRRLTGDRARLDALLRPLAFADRGGLPADIWRAASGRFRGGPPMSVDEQRDVLDVLGFFVAVTGHERPRYLLRHEAFAAYFRGGPADGEYVGQMTEAVLDAVPRDAGRRNWRRAPDYVRRNVLTHLAEAGRLDGLLKAEPACLAAVTVENAGAALARVTDPVALTAAEVFRRAAYAAGAPFAERAAAVQFHARLAGVRWLADALVADAGPLPWWSPWRAGGPPAAVPLGPPLRTGTALAVRTPDDRPALLVVDERGDCCVLDAVTRTPAGPKFSVVGRDGEPAALVAWNAVDGQVDVAAVDATGTVRVWAGTGPDAGGEPLLVVPLPPPVAHVVPVRGPGGVQLLWLAAGEPPEVTLWAVGGRAAQPAEPLVDPQPFDGRYAVGVVDGVLTATRDGELRLWTYAADGRPRTEVVAASGDPVWRLLVRGSAAQLCLVVDRERALDVLWWPGPAGGGGAEVGPGGRLVHVAFDGATLVTGNSRGEVAVWDLARRVAVRRAGFHVEGTVRALELLDADRVAVGTWDGRVRVHRLDPADGAAPQALLDHGEALSEVIALGAVADGPLLATRSLGGLTKLWKVAGPGPDDAMGAPDPVRLLAAAPLDAATDLIASAAEGRPEIEIRLLRPQQPVDRGPSCRLAHGEEAFALAAAPLDGGGAAVCATGDELLSVWTVDRNGHDTPVGKVATDDQPIEHLLLLTAGRARPSVVRGGPEGLTVTEFGPDGAVDRYRWPDVEVTSLSIERHGDRDVMVVGTDEGLLQLVESAAYGTWRARQVEHEESIAHACVLAGDGDRLVLAGVGRSGSVRLWTADDGGVAPRAEFRTVTEVVHAVPVTVDGERLVAWLDLTGALQVVDLLAPDGPRLVDRVPGPGGRPKLVLAASGPGSGPVLAVPHSTGRLLLARPGTGCHLVADLNCDLTALVHAHRCGFFVGAYGAALIGLTLA